MTSVLQFHDREVVLVADLAPIITEWLAEQQRIHEREWGTKLAVDKGAAWQGSETNNFVRGCGPISRLCFESGLPERRIWGITRGEQASVSLDVADRVMMAMDKHVSDLPVHDYYEVKEAVTMQTELIRQVVRCSGGYIALGKQSRTEFPRLRRLLTQAA